MNYIYAVESTNDSLSHHGTKGQKWGIRRYQNSDGSLTAAGRSRYGYGKEKYGISSNTGHRRAASDALKTESKLQKRYNKASKKPDSDKFKNAKKELDTFKSNKEKAYKELGMSKAEAKFRDIEASYNRRQGKAIMAGWLIGGPFGAVGAYATSSLTAKGRDYLEAYRTTKTDYEAEKNRSAKTVKVV